MTHLRIPVLRVLLGGILGLLLALGGAAPALAHAQLESSTPAEGDVVAEAPARATLTFDEHVRPIQGATELVAPDGASTPLSAHSRDDTVLIDLPADLAEGTYTLDFRVVSADGHPVGGELVFSVGASSAQAPVATPAPASGTAHDSSPVEPLFDALTALEHLSALLLAGAILLRALLPADPAVRRVLTGRRARRALHLLAGVLALSLVLLAPVGAAREAGAAPLAEGIEARPLIAAACGLVAAALVLAARGAQRVRLALPAAVLALAAPLLVGHSASQSPHALMLAADAAHLLAGALWTGGLLALVAVLVALRRDPGAGPAAAIAVLRRFSSAALVSVLLLGASGLVMAWLILPGPGALATTAWGRTLLVKLLVVAVAVGLAAWNRMRLLPALAARGAGEDEATWTRLLRTLRREAALLLGVVAISGLLVNLSPHDHAAADTGTEVSETAH